MVVASSAFFFRVDLLNRRWEFPFPPIGAILNGELDKDDDVDEEFVGVAAYR